MKRGQFCWARLPGLPKTMMWPVRREPGSTMDSEIVYCKADNAIFTVKTSNTEELLTEHWADIGLSVDGVGKGNILASRPFV
uniref:Uncharacterized protein n=1 Tax=Magallana gigas TaxID=29159 RepID=A0A8W8NPC0_MAGGI